MHLFQLGEYLTGMPQQRLTRQRRGQAAMVTGKKRHAKRRFKLGQAVTGRGGRQMNPGGCPGQTATVGNRGNQAQIRKVVIHGFVQNECLL